MKRSKTTKISIDAEVTEKSLTASIEPKTTKGATWIRGYSGPGTRYSALLRGMTQVGVMVDVRDLDPILAQMRTDGLHVLKQPRIYPAVTLNAPPPIPVTVPAGITVKVDKMIEACVIRGVQTAAKRGILLTPAAQWTITNEVMRKLQMVLDLGASATPDR